MWECAKCLQLPLALCGRGFTQVEALTAWAPAEMPRVQRSNLALTVENVLPEVVHEHDVGVRRVALR
jgi:hypothetical protein